MCRCDEFLTQQYDQRRALVDSHDSILECRYLQSIYGGTNSLKTMNKFTSLFFLIALLCLSACAKQNDPGQIIGDTSQNIFSYINPKELSSYIIDKPTQNKLTQAYLLHYFSPWTNQNRFKKNNEIKQKESTYLTEYQQHPGVGENHLNHSNAWIENITQNVNLEKLGINERNAIVSANSDLRVLPTNDPSFSSLTKAGQFYPFDNLQESFLSVGTPIVILQTTNNGKWDLILTHNDYGWIQHQHVAYVDVNFMHQWQSGKYEIVISDDVSVTLQNNFLFSSRLGALFPVSDNGNNNLFVPIRDTDQNAKLILAHINNNAIRQFPMDFSVNSFIMIIQKLVGNPYGWGSIYGYRDCSATMVDLFSPFGVWLPRNSSQQIKIGQTISLEGLTSKEKQKIIRSQGKPFITLVGLPGHITLYIGTYHNNPYLFQNIWGLHTGVPFLPFLGEGRAIIGQTVITPINFDNRFLNVPTKFIDKINQIAVLDRT